MDWYGFGGKNEHSYADAPSRINWTEPFFKNILGGFNGSLYGAARIRAMDSWDGRWIEIISEAPFGILTASILILLIDAAFKKDTTMLKKNIFNYSLFIHLQKCITFITFITFMIVLPLTIVLLSLFYIYKMIVKCILKIKLGENFISMMDGMDRMWAIEDVNSKSILNIICTVKRESSNTKDGILNKFRNDIESKIFKTATVCPKMLNKRASFMGFHYWEVNDDLNINNFVRSMDLNESTTLTEDALQNYVENNSNADLPYENTSLWEIVVSEAPMEGTGFYPVLFRIHHSLGDGVALMDLLLNTIGTPVSTKASDRSETQRRKEPFNLHYCINRLIYKVIIVSRLIYNAPMSLFNQTTRPRDENVLHGPELNGRKVTAWMTDGVHGESLVTAIKRTKAKITGVTFSEIIMTGLSYSLERHFHKNKDIKSIPEMVTAVIPVRVEPHDFNKISSPVDLKLENKFSIAMLTVPIVEHIKHSSILKNLILLRKETDCLRQSVDFQVNYVLLKIGSALLPESFLRPALKSMQPSLVVSNLPGPSDVIFCGDYRLEQIAFFVPNRGTTGVGVTAISCNGRLSLGIMADSAVISNNKEGRRILENMIDGIKMLDDITSKRVISYYE